MGPAFLVNNCADCRSRYAILFAQSNSISPFISFTNLSDFFIRKLFNSVTVFSRSFGSTFRNHISSIIRAGPNKKMARSYALRIITSVTDHHSFWNESYVQLIRKSMSRNGLVFWIKSTISMGEFCTGPYPTSGSNNKWSLLVNFIPKSFFEACHGGSYGTE